MLTSEFEACNLAGSKAHPEFAFGGGSLAETSCPLGGSGREGTPRVAEMWSCPF
jgi:hypothetical protein